MAMSRRMAAMCSFPSAMAVRSYSVSAKEIQRLRFRTDAAIMDCKKALIATEGDFDAAITWLQKNGAAKAVKKGDRVTDYGALVAALSPNAKGAAIIQVCSETDFAARNEKFLQFADNVRLSAITQFDETNHGLMEQGVAVEEHEARKQAYLEQLQKSVEGIRAQTVANMGENLTVKALTTLPPLTPEQKESVIASDVADLFGYYVHNSIGPFAHIGSIASLVQLQPRDAETAARICPEVIDASEVAQHIVANLGNDKPLTQQNLLGTDETAGQWMKRHHVKLQRSVALKFGEPAQTQTIAAPHNKGK